MATTPVYNTTVTRGDTWERVITWGTSTTALYDLTDYSAEFTVRDGQEVLLNLSSDDTDGFLSIDPTADTITVHLPATLTAQLPVTNGTYSLRATSPAGVVTRLLVGTMAITD
jgi:hypothetical protein